MTGQMRVKFCYLCLFLCSGMGCDLDILVYVPVFMFASLLFCIMIGSGIAIFSQLCSIVY